MVSVVLDITNLFFFFLRGFKEQNGFLRKVKSRTPLFLMYGLNYNITVYYDYGRTIHVPTCTIGTKGQFVVHVIRRMHDKLNL